MMIMNGTSTQQADPHQGDPNYATPAWAGAPARHSLSYYRQQGQPMEPPVAPQAQPRQLNANVSTGKHRSPAEGAVIGAIIGLVLFGGVRRLRKEAAAMRTQQTHPWLIIALSCLVVVLLCSL